MSRVALISLSLGFAATLFAPVSARAQRVDEQLWTQTNARIAVDKATRVTIEGIARFSDRNDGLFHTEIGGIVTHKLSEHVEIGVGYRHVSSHGRATADDEDRLRQHVVLTYGRITSRLRIEQTFHPDGAEIGVRIRPLLRYNHPLRGDAKLFVSHESFFLPNSTDWGQRAGYDRMRNIVGVSLPLAEDLSTEIGYLNQYRFARNGGRAQMDHILSAQLTLSL